MAESPTTPPQTAYAISLTCDVLPILKMAGWVALTAKSNSEVNTARLLTPSFDKAYKGALGPVQFFAPGDPIPLLTDVLEVAARLLEVVTAAHGGDI
ncbi:hypothetical protein [Hydrogenophaga sp. OTU3427]|uniref:hypothetical protein n=1 Tax=Hydrogenophaga sp. OTU3427 TaxID=3043856 RepID=UPI00313BD972